MKKLKKVFVALTMVPAVLLAMGLWMLPEASAQSGGPLRRHTADFLCFGGSGPDGIFGTADDDCLEVSTTALPAVGAAGGFTIFTKTAFVPAGDNVLYVTVNGTSDTHDGAALMIACLVNGAPCNPGSSIIGGAPGGWVTVTKLPFGFAAGEGCGGGAGDGGGGGGDCHDNVVSYTWCIPKEPAGPFVPGANIVDIKIASSTGGTVFMEALHFFIDSNKIDTRVPNKCTQAPNPVVDGASLGVTSLGAGHSR